MQRYFVENENISLPFIYICGDDCHHISVVMRMKINDKVYISNQVKSWIAQIINIEKDKVTLEVLNELNEQKELPFNVCIAQGVVRREKMEEVIDYITELGASSYLPVQMERSIVKVNEDVILKKLGRLNKIAKEAAEQSHRIKIMDVLKTVSFKEFLAFSKSFDLCLYAYEASTKDDSFKKIIKSNKYQNILVLVGPEGGISDKEKSLLDENGFLAISLGPRILRTQVAPLYVMSALSYEWESEE